ncbi:MAG: hypothetical protein R2845_09795 [Thermomicrobiales bacterium]
MAIGFSDDDVLARVERPCGGIGVRRLGRDHADDVDVGIVRECYGIIVPTGNGEAIGESGRTVGAAGGDRHCA